MDVPKKCFRSNEILRNVSNMLVELRQENTFCDVTLICEDGQMNAHKVILASSSEFFRSILKRNPHPSPLVYLRGVKFTLLRSVIQFIYEGSVKMEQSEVEPFLALGKDLGIKGLAADNASCQSIIDDVQDLNLNSKKDIPFQGKDFNGNQTNGSPFSDEDYPSTTANSKSVFSGNRNESKQKKDEHDTKTSSCTNAQISASANVSRDQIEVGDENGDTSPDHYPGDDINKEDRTKRKKSKESDASECSKRHCSSNTEGSSFNNTETPVQDIINQNHSEIRGNGNAGAKEVPLTSLPSSSEIQQQKLRQDLLNSLKQYEPSDDNHSLYSDYDPQSECSSTSEAESLTVEDEKKREAASAVLREVDYGWWCTFCQRIITRKQNAFRHVQNIHYKNETVCNTCNFKFKNLLSFARHGCQKFGKEYDSAID